jgi:SPP1 gp7 family putative phage head morphogenesis protein
MFAFLAKLFSSQKLASRSFPNRGKRDIRADDITVEPELTPKRKAIIAAKLTDSLRNSGANIAADRIPALQQRIQDLVFSGSRAETIAKVLAREYDLDKHQAARIARLAASLVMSKYREDRARAAGSTRYRWSTCHDEMVCMRCRELDGKIFSWDNPPEGGHPGEYECWRLIYPDYVTGPVGRLDSRCPNCEVELAKRPRAKAKCKNCQKDIWVRTNAEGQQVLLSEEMLENFDLQKYGPQICRCRAIPITAVDELVLKRSEAR